MPQFRDQRGRCWVIDVNVAAIKRVRSMTGVDLLDLGQDGALKRLGDPVMLCDVLYALVHWQAEAAKVSDEDFGAALAGDVIDAASRALVESWVDFFPDARVRTALRRAIEAGDQQMQAQSAAMLAAIDAQIATASGGSSMSVPASSESTPDR